MITSFQDFWSNKNYRIASIIGLLMIVWMATGLFASDTPSAPEPNDPASKNTQASIPVRVTSISAQTYPLVVSLNGKTEANRRVDVRAEVSGQIENLPLEKGSVVKAGQVICRIAAEDRELRVSEAQAAVDQAQIEYDGALRLKTGGYQSEAAIATAKSRLETSKANLLRRQLDLEKTAIRAPFAGVVNERPVELGELMRAGDVCATILDLDPLLITAQVSEQEIGNVPVNGEITTRLITGQRLQGKIRYVGRSSDDITRTFRIEAEVPNPQQNLAAGITAEVRVLTREVEAHLIPAALLVLDDEGELGVRVLDSNNIVEQYPVELVGDDAGGVWVTGLPRQTRLITVGHEYVGVGEKVQVSTGQTEMMTKDKPLNNSASLGSDEQNSEGRAQ